MYNILLVEDSVESYQLVKMSIGQMAHLEWAKTLREGADLLAKKTYDLLLLDLTLPDGEGYRLCSMMQTDDRLRLIPVIFLTAKNAVSDKVMGFSVGAEDFITKPFDFVELKARVESRLRKRERERAGQDHIRLGDLEINRSTQRVFSYKGGDEKLIDLTPLEFKLLLFLARKVNHVHSREEVLNGVWGDDIYVFPRSVDTHISKLRKKLGDVSHYVDSVHGVGYRFKYDDSNG